MLWSIHFKFDVWITHGQRKVPFENRHQVAPPDAAIWKWFPCDNSGAFWSIHLKFYLWITRGQRKVPFENWHQVVPSENGFHAITRECFDQFTSHLACGSLMDRGRFPLKTAPGGAAWCHQVGPSENGFRMITREHHDWITSIWSVDHSWTEEGSFRNWHHLKMVSVR